MNENLDLTKILEGCPVGTKFYSTIFGEVSFSKIISDDYDDYPIELMVYNKNARSIVANYCEKDGKYSCAYEGECTLFPSKDQRDWSKFERFWDNPNVEELKSEKFNPTTLQPFDKVLARDFLSDDWMADFFEKIEENDVHYNVTCVTCKWAQCIPYNNNTKHLLGTKEDCPEYYKWWEE